MTSVDFEDLISELTERYPAEPTPNLPASFWEERPALRKVRQAAHAAAGSPDAVLGVVLARVAVLTPPTIRLPAPVGTPAPLGVLIALVGQSGAGKSSSARIAADLVPIDGDDPAVVPLGSGEGIVESYIGDVDSVDEEGKIRKVRGQVRRSVLFMLDEGQALAEMGSRKGSTLLPTIRSAWSGDRLGQANATAERRRHLEPDSYGFALVAGFQTEYANSLIEDRAGGTPQRFLFFAAEDPSIPDIAPSSCGPLDWRPTNLADEAMTITGEITAEIRNRALARARGEVVSDPLDSHRDLSRLKVAGLLALLDNRFDINHGDWRLAGDILDASDRVRQTVIDAARFRSQDAERTSIRKADRRAAALESSSESRALDGMATAIARHVRRNGCDDGCKRRCVTQATKSSHRRLVTADEAIEEAVRRGWVVVDGKHFKPGREEP